MKRLRSPKVCAALVMIAWLASLFSFWGMSAAGAEAIGTDTSCSVSDLDGVGVRLEMASQRDEVLAILGGEPPSPAKADCIRRGEAAAVRADTFFLISYSLLTLTLFLFVRALRASSARPALLGILLTLGVLLALTMAIGDLVENHHLTELIRLAGQEPPGSFAGHLPDLRIAAYVKMGALALSAALLGALWSSRSRWVWLLRLLAFGAAAVFTYGMVNEDWQIAVRGMGVFAAFALAALIHAIAVAVDREAYPGSRPLREGGPKS
jgi:hypothetical protein